MASWHFGCATVVGFAPGSADFVDFAAAEDGEEGAI